MSDLWPRVALIFHAPLWVILFFHFCNPGASEGASHAEKTLQQNCQNCGYAVSIDNKIIKGHRLNESFIPASTIKVVTTLAALEILGPNYRFQTQFYLDRSGNLYIKGQGDPFLISENIRLIVQQLLQKGLPSIQTLVLDNTYFSLAKPTDGSTISPNPYDAVNDALCFNFNTLTLKVDRDGNTHSAEPQTPFLPLMNEIGRQLPPGIHRVNVDAYPSQTQLKNRDRLAGEVFLAILSEYGFAASDIKITRGVVPNDALHFHTYRSQQTLDDIIQNILKYSNNFVANQIFLACGVERFSPPATWEKARKSFDYYLYEQLQFRREDIHIVEGSGLSRKNRVTPLAMLKILNLFRPHAHLLSQKKGIRIKSGTLTNVYSYTGYFQHDDNIDPFIVLLNQQINSRDQVLDLLLKRYKKEYEKLPENP